VAFGWLDGRSLRNRKLRERKHNVRKNAIGCGWQGGGLIGLYRAGREDDIMGSLSIWHWVVVLILAAIWLVPAAKILTKAGYSGW
jgi:hypothetical protein